jgi:hypothetical protein
LDGAFHGIDSHLGADVLNPENEEPAPRSSKLTAPVHRFIGYDWFRSDQCCFRGWRLKPLFVGGGVAGAPAGWG